MCLRWRTRDCQHVMFAAGCDRTATDLSPVDLTNGQQYLTNGNFSLVPFGRRLWNVIYRLSCDTSATDTRQLRTLFWLNCDHCTSWLSAYLCHRNTLTYLLTYLVESLFGWVVQQGRYLQSSEWEMAIFGHMGLRIPKLLNRSSWNLARLITSSIRPHMPNLLTPLYGFMGPRVLFLFFFFSFFGASTEHSVQSGFTLYGLPQNVFWRSLYS